MPVKRAGSTSNAPALNHLTAFSRAIVGWSVSNSLHSDIALSALEQALSERLPDSGLIHHSDRGTQYLAIRYTDRLKEAGVESSVGSAGDSYDNALAETVNGLYKAEVIYRLGPWSGRAHVERSTFDWVHWFNNKRILEPLNYMSPRAFEERY